MALISSHILNTNLSEKESQSSSETIQINTVTIDLNRRIDSLLPIINTNPLPLHISHSLPRWRDSKFVKKSQALSEKEKVPQNLLERTKKEYRQAQRQTLLTQLEIPLNSKELNDLLKAVDALKERIPSHNDPQAFPVTINGKIGRIEVYHRKDDGKKDILITFLEKKQLLAPPGTSKTFYSAWTLTKAPKRLAYGIVDRFYNRDISLAIEEADYFNQFRESGFFPKLFKCTYFKNNEQHYQVLVMKYCPSDLLMLLQAIEKNPSRLSEMTSDQFKLLTAISFVKCVDFLHQQKIIHRDLKPDNILITNGFKPLLCDLGFAILSTDITEIEDVKCSTQYLAPEAYAYVFRTLIPEAVNDYCDPKDFTNNWNEKRAFALDTWTIGCILWQISTLAPFPWSEYHLKPEKYLDLIKRFQQIPISEAGHPLENLIRRLLQKDPLKRPETKEIINVLIQIQKDLPEKNTFLLSQQLKHLNQIE